MTASEKGWVAGFLEGEGSFSRRLGIRAGQKQAEPLLRLQRIIGAGRVYRSTPITGNGRRRDPSWRYYWYGQPARDFMKKIFPLMSPRRQEQITKALQ